jgi:hypothetical protein
VALGIALNALAFACLTWIYPSLPAQVAVQFGYDPELGEAVADTLRPRAYAWTLPAIGLSILVVNSGLGALAHSRGRLASVLLAIAATLAQVAIIALLLRMVP